MEKPKEKQPLLLKQKIMRRVIFATLPCILASIYFFGWRSLVVVAVSCAAAFLTEFLFNLKRKEPVSEAVFVSGILYALIMPPTVPWHVLVIGIVFAIIFAKMVFGGFGRNIFNPAMVGRAFCYISFPVALTAKWAPAASLPWGALGMWSTAAPDAITSATPLALVKAGTAAPPPILDLLVGNVSGTMGVTSVIAILIGGIYLFASGTANRWIILMTIGVYGLVNLVADMAGMPNAPGALVALMGGGYLFGAFFMATDPVSAPKTLPAQLIYGGLIALSTFVIRNFSVFNGGMMFSILLANMFAPILDYAFKQTKNRKQEKSITKTEEAGA
jgi:Na+-transporting NADH:ubiquinone oxidoreductase subunit B